LSDWLSGPLVRTSSSPRGTGGWIRSIQSAYVFVRLVPLNVTYRTLCSPVRSLARRLVKWATRSRQCSAPGTSGMHFVGLVKWTSGTRQFVSRRHRGLETSCFPALHVLRNYVLGFLHFSFANFFAPSSVPSKPPWSASSPGSTPTTSSFFLHISRSSYLRCVTSSLRQQDGPTSTSSSFRSHTQRPC